MPPATIDQKLAQPRNALHMGHMRERSDAQRAAERRHDAKRRATRRDVSIRLDADQRATLEHAASEHGVTLAGFIRAAALHMATLTAPADILTARRALQAAIDPQTPQQQIQDRRD